jgi:acyl-coenzyme A synthetase/AMP-(fatty) acid ligase
VQFVASVPITSSGKIMRRLLKDVDDGTRTATEKQETRAG